MALGPLAQAWVRGRMRRGEITRDTARNHRTALSAFVTVVGNRPVHRLSQREIHRFLETQAHLAPGTRRQRFTVIRSFCAWLVTEGHVRRNPCHGVPSPKVPRSQPRGLTADQVAAVLAACPDRRARLIVTLMVQEGLRCCEVSRLEVGDVNLPARTLRVTGKGGHVRVLYVTDEAHSAIAGWLGERGLAAGPLIRSHNPPYGPLTPVTVSNYVRGWMKAAGVKERARDGRSAHALRHTCATDMLYRGAHLRDVQAALGHQHLTTTEVYLPPTVRGLAEAMEGRCYDVV